MSSVKQVLDEYFQGVNFDAKLYKKLVYANVEFMTRDADHTQLFSGRNIGCYYIKYTMYDKNLFYSSVFWFSYDDIVQAIDNITTIPGNFKVARDDINLVVFYIAHRFLTNDALSDKLKKQYAEEILNYFSYRTLVLITSNYFVYPISEQKATTLTERLNGKYIIKNVKNWNDYCQYRSQEFLKSKFLATLQTLSDADLPNAISDLYSRTKDTIKSIYVEFMDMIESDDVIKSRNAVVIDSEGKESVADRISTMNGYLNKVESAVSDKTAFVRPDVAAAVCDILSGVNDDQLLIFLSGFVDYGHLDRKSHDRVKHACNDILLNAIEYLQKYDTHLHDKTDIISVMSSIVGNVLYARGTDVSIAALKTQLDKLVKDVYKHLKLSPSGRVQIGIRNALYLYVFLLGMLSSRQ